MWEVKSKITKLTFVKLTAFLLVFSFTTFYSSHQVFAGGSGGDGMNQGSGTTGSTFTKASGAAWFFQKFKDHEKDLMAAGQAVHIQGSPHTSGTGEAYITNCQGAQGFYRFSWIAARDNPGHPVLKNGYIGIARIGGTGDNPEEILQNRTTKLKHGLKQYRNDITEAVHWEDVKAFWLKIFSDENYKAAKEELIRRGYIEGEFERETSGLGWFCAYEPSCPADSIWNEGLKKCCKKDGSDCPTGDTSNSCPADSIWDPSLNKCCKKDGSDCPNNTGDGEDRNFGNTTGRVGVINSSSTSTAQSWKYTPEDNHSTTGADSVSVFAKPGDSIKFEHKLSFPVQGVAGNTSFGGEITKNLSNKPSSYFRITSEEGREFLFGHQPVIEKNRDSSTNVNIYLEKSDATPKEVRLAEQTGNYSFTLYSPSNTMLSSSSPNNSYSCLVGALVANEFKPGHFQVPGANLSNTNCFSARAVRNDSRPTSVVGNTFSQSLTFNNLEGWVNRKSRIQGVCSGSTNGRQHNNYRSLNNYQQAVAADSDSHYNKWGHVHNLCEPYTDSYESCSGTGKNRTCTTHTRTLYTDHPDNGKIHASTTFTGANEEVVKTARVYVPYNFTTEINQVTINDDSQVVYGGSGVTIDTAFSIKEKDNPSVSTAPYKTITPHNSKAQLVEFTIYPDSAVHNNPNYYENIFFKGDNNVSTSDVCNYIDGKNVSGINKSRCNLLSEISGGSFNPGGNLKGTAREGRTPSAYITVPDLPDGTKYCVAMGVYPSDSHNYGPVNDDTNRGIAMRGGSTWNISGITCRTIVKKPNFQVWGGSVYTPNGIKTSITKKVVGAKIGQGYEDIESINDASDIFGSWAEYGLIAGGQIRGMSSGAGLGYYTNANTNLTLKGGRDYDHFNNLRTISDLSIANNGSNKNIMGSSGITATSSGIINKLKGRYRNLYEKPQVKNQITEANPTGADINAFYTLDNGIEYVKISGSTTLAGLYGNPVFKEMRNRGNGKTNTRVYYIDGDLTIASNVCYSGSNIWEKYKECYDPGTHPLSHYDIKTDNIADLPQILIFANNINIQENVSRIDAWLIADGNINTCNSFRSGINGSDPGTSSAQCAKTLALNGPVFAKSIELNRTAGANHGFGSDVSSVNVLHRGIGADGSTANPYYQSNTIFDGSITPAEIFNLRADAYYWAYSQAQRSSEVVTTYTRELAPRY